MDGLVISRDDKLKIICLINALNAYANLEHPRDAITKIYLAQDAFMLHKCSLLIREIGQSICTFYLDFYRQYPAEWQ